MKPDTSNKFKGALDMNSVCTKRWIYYPAKKKRRGGSSVGVRRASEFDIHGDWIDSQGEFLLRMSYMKSSTHGLEDQDK